jgi:hypothetical protein
MKKGSPIKSIEKDLRHAEKNIKKNWWKYFFILIISIVVLIFLLSFAGMRIRFVLRDALVIAVNPPEASFTIPNDQNQSVGFDIEVTNSRFCSANCSYALYDRSESVVLAQGEGILKGNSQFEKEFVLEPYRKGSGQKIFNFDLECQNIRSFLCASEGPVRRASSFIVLNYNLTGEEALYKEEMKPILIQAINDINNASSQLGVVNSLLKPDFINKTGMEEKYEMLDSDKEKSLRDVRIAKDYWGLEEYVSLYNFKARLLNISSLLENANTLRADIEGAQSKENALIRDYNQMLAGFMEEINNTYTNDTNISNAIGETASLFWDIGDEEYTSIKGFGNDLSILNSTLENFKKELIQNEKRVEMEGKNLTAFEYSKSCQIGYCQEPGGDTCADLQNITMEYDTRWFPLPENITPEPYYVISDVVEILVDNHTRDFITRYCIKSIINISMPPLEEINPVIGIENVELIENDISENLPQCCVYGECTSCCDSDSCRNDPALFPILFIHGHSLLRSATPQPLLDIFDKIQYQMQDDGFVNAGTVYYNLNFAQKANEWGLANKPITVKVSYYYDYYYSLGKYIYITRSTDNIDTYAIRLNDIIKGIKYKTGKPKVNLIAHSMGGLVVRRYMQIFGDDSVDKVILIATPNHGIEGTIRQWCDVLGEKLECEDMYSDSVFIKKLNDPNTIPNAKIYTISGVGCNMDGTTGDGVVTLNSSILSYAQSFVINGTCNDSFGVSLHNEILDIDKYPGVYQDILDILKD